MSSATPAKLYKYQSFNERTLTSLKSRTLWFGKPSRLNDPFDCEVPYEVTPVTLGDCERLLARRDDPDWQRLRGDRNYVDEAGKPNERFRLEVETAARNALAKVVADSYGSRGVTCFSESPLSTLLWSHYGGGHRGLCLEFDTADPELRKFHPITYTDTAPQINIVDVLLGDEAGVLWGMLTKASCWSYEQEWRAIHAKADTEYCYGIDALTGVYLGAKLSVQELDLICHLLHGSPAKLYHVRKREGSFALESYELTYEPYRRS